MGSVDWLAGGNARRATRPQPGSRRLSALALSATPRAMTDRLERYLDRLGDFSTSEPGPVIEVRRRRSPPASPIAT